MSDLMTSSMGSKELDKPSLAMRTYSMRRSLLHSPSSLDVSQMPTYSTESSLRRKNFMHRRSRSYDTSIPDLTSLKLYKTEKKKSFESLLEYDYTAAVFETVKEDDLGELEAILDVRSEAINEVNADGMSVLDVALLLDSLSITDYLLQHNANTHLLRPREASNTDVTEALNQLISECEQAIATLSGTIMDITNKHKVREKKLNVWINKRKVLKKMKMMYAQTSLPPNLKNISLSITSQSSLRVTFPPLDIELSGSSTIVGYKVEWCCCHTFPPEHTESIYLPAKHSQLQHDLRGLVIDVPYYIRVSAHNMKGFGESSLSEPKSAVPSSWYDCPTVEAKAKVYDAQRVLELYDDVKSYRTLDDSSSTSSSPDLSPQYTKPSSSRKKGLRSLFSSQSAKFAKSMKRGIYLACIFYHEEKILVTEDDKYLPMVEVDDSYNPTNLASDFSWLFKVCCHWEDVRQLKEDMDRLTSVTSYSLRNQLLAAATQLQALLGVSDLGRLHFAPVKDPVTGAVVFPLVKQVLEPKSLASLQNVKWSSHLKLHKSAAASDCFISLLSEMMVYRQVCDTPLPTGLYLGYLQAEVHNGSINLYTSQLNPNTLPMVKIRDNSHVSKTEWQSLLELSSSSCCETAMDCEQTNKQVLRFQSEISRASRTLINSMGISPEQMFELRLYGHEVLEFSPSVSMIVLLPPRDQVCNVQMPNHPSHTVIKPKNLISIPVKTFEISHMYTYQLDFIKSYTRAMVLIDMEFTAALQAHREAFTNTEIEATKQQVDDLRTFQRTLEDMWAHARWTSDVISLAREKEYTGISMRQLYQSVIDRHEQTYRDVTHMDSSCYGNRRSVPDP